MPLGGVLLFLLPQSALVLATPGAFLLPFYRRIHPMTDVH